MNLSGGYGTFIYTFLPAAVLGVLGVTFIQESLDPNAVLVETATAALGKGVAKFVTAALLIALLLSSLNAIMGCARSLYMMALDGQGPRIFGRVNKHNVPDFSMGMNTVLNILLIFVGAPGSIYVLSNVGYVGSFVPVLLGYYFLRRWRPEILRPFRLPEWMKYGAVALAILYFFVWAVGIPACAIEGCQLGGGKMFILGVIVVLMYFPWPGGEGLRIASSARPTSRSRSRGGWRHLLEVASGGRESGPRRIPDPAKGPGRLPAAPLPAEVLARVVELATPEHAKITVLGVARVYGTSLGLPHPGLRPTHLEWDDLRGYVDTAAEILRAEGFEVRVALSRSRNAPKMIAAWVRAKNFHAVVVPDPPRARWRQVIEGDLAHEIERRCGVPVHAVEV
jgi:hypothetical protein